MGSICSQGKSQNTHSNNSQYNQDDEQEFEINLLNHFSRRQTTERKEETVTSFQNIREIYTFDPKIIGHGKFGSVRIATLKNNHKKKFAVKTISKEKFKQNLNILMREVEILKELDHPNIINFFETYQDQRFFHLVMEYCSGGELFRKVGEEGCFKEEQAAIVMQRIFQAVRYLHAIGIVHRDLKLENFLFSHKGDDAEIKLIDFGLSSKYNPEVSNSLTTVAGTALYVAPEVLDSNYDLKCDIWSCGVIMYFLLCGRPPFTGENNQEIFTKIKAGKFTLEGLQWKKISKQAKDLISKLLVVDKSKRMTVKDALRHPWFKQFLPKNNNNYNELKILTTLQNFPQMPPVKQEVFKIISYILDDKEIKPGREAFRALDTSNQGVINYKQLLKAYQRQNINLSEQDIKKIIKRVSLDDEENYLTYSSFLCAVIDRNVLLTKERINALFKYFDNDNTNFITVNNITEALARNGRKLQQADLISLFQNIGLHNKNQIDLQEFTYILTYDDLSKIPINQHKLLNGNQSEQQQTENQQQIQLQDQQSAKLTKNDSNNKLNSQNFNHDVLFTNEVDLECEKKNYDTNQLDKNTTNK